MERGVEVSGEPLHDGPEVVGISRDYLGGEDAHHAHDRVLPYESMMIMIMMMMMMMKMMMMRMMAIRRGSRGFGDGASRAFGGMDLRESLMGSSSSSCCSR